ncbi:MAG: ACP S-malonyltransferase [Desulfobacterales bacterium]|jgi:[acyl-carrier-protein] S-malonyltransferase
MKKMAFLFPGQGSQVVGMGQDFHQEFGFVRELFDMAEEISRISLRQLCFKGPMEELTRTVNLQPAVTVVNLAFLAAVQRETDKPVVSAGHSLGEYSALHAAGVVSAEDAIRLVHKRGELMHREAIKNKGAMSALLGLTVDEVEEIVERGRERGVVSVANHNTAQQIVITGEPAAVAAVSAYAAEKGAKAIPLKVSGAWHSELIRGAEEDFKAFLQTIAFNSPQSAVVFNVTADTESDPDEIRSVMSRQLCNPVKWYDSMKQLVEAEIEIFLEIGPGKVLTGLLRKNLPKDYPATVFTVNDLNTFENFIKKTS